MLTGIRMTPNTQHMLEEAGWSVECISPLELRHADGSFASLNAAEMVIECLRRQAEEARASIALNTIQGCACLAKQSCDGHMQKLWEAVERDCRKALAAES